ncbi:DNA ligase D [Niveibacterium sp. SC-1]|uniref:DNA ligase D n=1 Tax=Niveibacterium sp. SC-1 TaxID=3135646 RepID=UPI00311F8AC5
MKRTVAKPQTDPTDRSSDPLDIYREKRDFTATPEPSGGRRGTRKKRLSYVIQKHAATRLHYDFRLEYDGVLLSWAVPKGPSFDPTDKRLAIHVEDHPLSYGSFEGTIPRGHYGAGQVIVWDNGSWEPEVDPREGLANGKLVFQLHGQKLAGRWELVKIAKPGERQEAWLLFKKRDEFARPNHDYDVVSLLPDSVVAKPLEPPKARSGTRAKAPSRRTKKLTPGSLPGAVEAALPKTLSPQLATLASDVPKSGGWRFELKFDGYRILARIADGAAQLFTRNGHDWSAKMPQLVEALSASGIDEAWLDGEIVVLDEEGAPNFNALQNALDPGSPRDEIVYFLFDLPFCGGYDLRGTPLQARRDLLEQVVDKAKDARLRFSASFDTDAATALATVSRLNFEGVIAKRIDSTYTSTRSDAWLKLKCRQRQEFVICGFTERDKQPDQIGSLILGVHSDRKWVPVGNVGTGWDAAEAQRLKSRLDKLLRDTPPFADGPAKPGRWSRRPVGSERWVEPRLVAEVEFGGWTPEGKIRHAVYLGLRTDKPARDVVRETLQPASPGKGDSQVGSVRVSHGDRVIDASTGISKIELVRYYESVAEWMVPHLRGRPCSLMRAPKGVEGNMFFQKHGDAGIPGIRILDEALWPEHEALLEVPSLEALIGAAQMNVIEFHTWNSTVKKIAQPDRIVFDLDPGEGVKWQAVQEAATLVRGLLEELGLQSWLKTSGGKGLHVVVPIAPRLDFAVVKDFSRDFVKHMSRVIPARFTATSGATNRVGRIFVDYLRNGEGATTVAAFSARARPGLGVSMPVAWEELEELKSGAQWTVRGARERLSFQKVDPWAQYWKTKQTLATAMKRLRA